MIKIHKNGTIFKLNITPKFSEIEGEIAGIFAGDGSQYFEQKSYHYENNIHFGGQNYQYAIYVKNLYEGFFNKKFMFRKESLNRYRLRTHSKEIFYFFKNYLDYIPQIKHYTVKLKSLNLPKKFKIGFLRGLIDTDGNIRFIKNEKRTRVTFCTTSKELSIQICYMLTEFEINNSSYVQEREYRDEKPVYYVIVWKDSTDRFINLIKPLKARTEKGW